MKDLFDTEITIMQEQQAEARRLIIEFRYTRLTGYERLMKQIDRELGRNIQRGGYRVPFPARVVEQDKHHNVYGW